MRLRRRHEDWRGNDAGVGVGVERPPREEVELEFEARLVRASRLGQRHLDHVASQLSDDAANALEEAQQLRDEGGIGELNTHDKDHRFTRRTLPLDVPSRAGRKSELSHPPEVTGAKLRPRFLVLGAAALAALVIPHSFAIGDVFRLVLYLVLLAGAAREIRAYWRSLADAAVLEERRRIARDLHNGMAQELAFIVMRSKQMLAAPADRAGVEQVAVAAQRALDESRRAIAALTRPLDEPVDGALTPVAEDERVRFDAAVEGDPDGFGGTGMRESTQGLGRALVVASRREHGTEVEVRVP